MMREMNNVDGWENKTLQYYKNQQDSFFAGTVSANMKEAHTRFLTYLDQNSFTLDFGCGSGRDTKAFLDLGYKVDATDGSEEMCRKASAYTGISVRKMLFRELDARGMYDGIWACASILHLPRPELKEVLNKIVMALKAGGILYTSFKYGTFEGMRNDRYFTDFTEETLAVFWQEIKSLEILEEWITQDVRTGREDEKWINILACRI